MRHNEIEDAPRPVGLRLHGLAVELQTLRHAPEEQVHAAAGARLRDLPQHADHAILFGGLDVNQRPAGIHEPLDDRHNGWNVGFCRIG